MRLRLDDILIIGISVITASVIVILYLYRMKIQNLRHTTKIFVELSILITDFKKALNRVKLFKIDGYGTEIEIHEKNYSKYKELIDKMVISHKNGRKSKHIFDIEKELNIDINTIKTKIRSEIRMLISYLQQI